MPLVTTRLRASLRRIDCHAISAALRVGQFDLPADRRDGIAVLMKMSLATDGAPMDTEEEEKAEAELATDEHRAHR
jgi:hypothetical protein